MLATNHTTLADHFGTAALEQEEDEGEEGAEAEGAQKKEAQGQESADGGGGGSVLQGAILDRLLKELVVSPKTEVRPPLCTL